MAAAEYCSAVNAECPMLRPEQEACCLLKQAWMKTSPSIAGTIYRPFFVAGILTVLTLGCAWVMSSSPMSGRRLIKIRMS